jgi:hypothetical protein
VIVVVRAQTDCAALRIIVIATLLRFLYWNIRHPEVVQQVACKLPTRSGYPREHTCIASEGVMGPPLRTKHQQQQEQYDK